MPQRNTLICTVGTSLFESNLKNLSATTLNAPPNWESIRNAYNQNNWKNLAAEMLKVQPTERICGAEINAIEEARKKNWLALENLTFLVSDTPNGKNTGEFLKIYFEQRRDLSLRNVEYHIVEHLQDERPKDFKIHGLRNLVRKAGECIKRFGGPEYIVIDATGGYKPQIAIAVILGQALNIPVFYRHESFPETIDFPPLPISFDYDILAKNADLLTDFERGAAYSQSDIGEIDEKLRVLLEEEVVDGQSMYELSAIGEIYLTGFRLRNPKPISLVPAQNKKAPSFGNDHHYPIGFKEFVEKVCRENQWIVTASSLPYSGQKAIKGIGFQVRQEDGKNRLIGTFQDKNNFGARFWIHVTDESPVALTWAADELNQKYR